jgi:hypothetical protein
MTKDIPAQKPITLTIPPALIAPMLKALNIGPHFNAWKEGTVVDAEMKPIIDALKAHIHPENAEWFDAQRWAEMAIAASQNVPITARALPTGYNGRFIALIEYGDRKCRSETEEDTLEQAEEMAAETLADLNSYRPA